MPTVSKVEQSQKTRRALLDSARELFTERGYAATPTEEIVRRANVTRGALQYHYGEKICLFRAVFEEIRAERVQRLQAVFEEIKAERIQRLGKRSHAVEGDAWEDFIVTGCRAFISNVKDPTVQRIIYTDGPAVLGSAAVRDNVPGLTFLRAALAQLMDAGLIRPLSLIPLSAILWATFLEAGLHIAQADADDLAQVEQETVAVLTTLLSALRSSPQ